MFSWPFRPVIQPVCRTACDIQDMNTLAVRVRQVTPQRQKKPRKIDFRTSSLCAEVLADIEAGRVTADTNGIEEFCRSLEESLTRLRPLLRQSETIGPPVRRK